MKLHKMFNKEIDRDIKGVIKIGQEDDENVYQELEEYVVTRELDRHFSRFFDAYKEGIGDYTDKMGIWISGFFGSGKSHFLKILSYLLKNRTVNGKKAVEYFTDKIDDPMVMADITRAGNVSSDVILFNIDSKSDSDTKSDKELIVKVFNKVFNEMQGFSGASPWLADLERLMTKEGTYGAFKSKFEEINGEPWEEMRDEYYFIEDDIVEALTLTTKMSEDAARNWFNKAQDSYSLSVEKFANKVKEYIEAKDQEHHVIFLVDEMGQYIGEDSNLMLNLQTVVEDLGTYCGGKAWVVVTSQQAIDSISSKVRGNDFSKIQGRFNTRLSLSSGNVDEVIKKRILAKSEPAEETLELIYNEKEAVLNNLITFSADTAEMKTYKNAEDFVSVYPFIPYQFNLLQSVFTAIRRHGASGKHLSEGERSLLSAYQETAVQVKDEEAGVLVPFSSFYETIETFLDHDVRTVMIHAEDNDRLNSFDVEVLKLLFLIKWVEEIPANIENLATLLVKNIDDDKIEIKKAIEQSLGKLIRETLIQKNGQEYIFLTNDEQDVNRQIQEIQVDIKEVIKEIGEEIFTGIYGENKFKYNHKYHFSFNKIIDDRHIANPHHEFGIKIITPYFDMGGALTEQEMKMMSSRENNLIIKLPEDTAAITEMEEVKKITTYLQRKGGQTGNTSIDEIKIRKGRERTERSERVKHLLTEALREAEFYVNSQKLDMKTKSPKERINEGLKAVVNNIYNKLSYVKAFVESNKDLHDLLFNDENQIEFFGEDKKNGNHLAEDEVRRYVYLAKERSMAITAKTLMEHFSKLPYGWLDNDIRGILIALLRKEEIRFQLGSEYIQSKDDNLITYLTKKEYTDRLVIEKRDKVNLKHLQIAKELGKDLFGYASLPDDEDGLMVRLKELAKEELGEINNLLVRYEQRKDYPYPGRRILEDGEALLKEILEIKEPAGFYRKLVDLEEELLDYSDDVKEVKGFFNNQKEIFDKAAEKLKIYHANETYVTDQELIDLVKKIEDIVTDRTPYTRIKELPNLSNEFVEGYTDLLEKEAKPIKVIIDEKESIVLEELESSEFKETLEKPCKEKFKSLRSRLESAQNFHEVIAKKDEADRIKTACLKELDKKKEEARKEREKVDEVPKVKPGEKTPPPYKPAPPKQKKRISAVELFNTVQEIETEEQVDELVDNIRKTLKEELKNNTKITFS
ncbi:BREX system P-loop protein BrxC [Isachenkonia alkalipeptolytica]|uniref:BREX system P-loop protein BrxC n=1 Tax=Isachenkonia alkalipeptolytica TaxID=2565777 RepID=A0AA43XJV0_9CLOT|nr:BREX system P-loop protein BrxC [Isachenkonia alkalipeptolytica]NBG87676.1 BREX system P-loop protein BrxC [Isachenkonia alkalipeptolytica]